MTTQVVDKAPPEPTALAKREDQPLVSCEGADAIRARLQVLRELRGALTKGVDFGTIRGCGPKPTLFKPGAEKILVAFGLSTYTISVDERRENNETTFRVMLGASTPDGIQRGVGIGQASTGEEKYAWRAANCQAEWDDAPLIDRRKKYTKGGEEILQVRVPPANQENTVLKMAFKRAKVALALDACAASEFYSQQGDKEEDRRPVSDRPLEGSFMIGGRVLDLTIAPAKTWIVEAYKDAGISRDQASDIISKAVASFVVPDTPEEYEERHIQILVEMFERAASKSKESTPPPHPAPPTEPGEPAPPTDDAGADENPSSSYAEAMEIARERGATQEQIEEAIRRALLRSTPSSAWVDSDRMTFLVKLDRILAVDDGAQPEDDDGVS